MDGLLEAVKSSLRITGADFDEDLTELIEAGLADMKMRGVDKTDVSAPLTRQAIKLYCRAGFANGDVKERDLYMDRYLDLAAAMALCDLYEEAEE